MNKVKNDSQPYVLYVFAIISLIVIDFIIGIFFIHNLSRFIDNLFKFNFNFNFPPIILTLAFGSLFYSITRAIKNGILYFVPREECYIEEDNLVYKRILFNKFILKKIKILLLDIRDIIDKGYKIPTTNGDYLNPLNYITTFFKPYERILIKMKLGEKFNIFIDANPYPYTKFYSYHDDNKFIKNYNDLKEMVINEQNKILFNQKIENLMEKYNSPLDERYNYILNKIVDEERLFIAKKDNNYIINGSYDAIEYLEIFKNIYFEEAELDTFYSYVLSKEENQDKKVLVGYNGTDGKEVTMSKLKEDINEIRDSRSMFKK
ncbi:hypothetical protein [Fusobacterium polymorphum]|uniref:hypothetical protein n=1 Tax=Fusobacterium nucleatum subsp. polymorphum TaxID=76857 RepID=UPI002B4C2031|nr:hypothetical protein [Fusobacterium polymorphum]WRL70195.1 hypothetical protein VKN81_08590 [Fusobacterium polymorphum]